MEQFEDRVLLSISPTALDQEWLWDQTLTRAIDRAADIDQYSQQSLAAADSWVVGVRGGYAPSLAASQLGADVLGDAPGLDNAFIWQFSTGTDSEDILGTLGSAEQVKFFYPLVPKQQQERGVPDDPWFPDQWHLLNTGQTGGTAGADANVVDAWDSYTGAGVVIGIVDDGLQYTHPDLVAQYRSDLSYDFNYDDSDPYPDGFWDDHGTAVAGVAAAQGNNGIGVSGAAPGAELAGLRLVALESTDLEEAGALTYKYDAPDLADVVQIYNNSWGPPDITVPEAPGPLALAAFYDGVSNGRGGLGSIYTWAGGNGREVLDNVNYDGYANSRFTIAVAAIDHDGVQSYYSEPGAPLLISAYSDGDLVGITTTDRVGMEGYNWVADATDGDGLPDIDYTSTFGGTSSATPLVSGVIALMLDANPDLSYRDVQHVLVESADKNDPTDSDWTTNAADYHINHKYGFGAIDADAAVALAETWRNVLPEYALNSGVVTLNASIPDNDATGISSTITLPAGVPEVEWAEVTLDAEHPYVGDLEVVLTSPEGTESILAELHDDPYTTYGYDRWTFTTARNWGESVEGDWTLSVRDLRGGSVGTFNNWELSVYGAIDPGAGPELVSIIPNAGALLTDGEVLHVAPQELLFRFDEGQVIDEATLDAIQIIRSGGDDIFGNGNDVVVEYGWIGLGDRPNEVIVRFAETLPDDLYRITIVGDGDDALLNIYGVPFNKGEDVVIEFDLDLGAQVIAVVPQPVSRDLNGDLQQSRDTIEVYFNDDELSGDSARDTRYYQLMFTGNTADPADDSIYSPVDVTYSPAENKAVLTFADDLENLDPNGLGALRLRIGNEYQKIETGALTPPFDPGSSFATANQDLGLLGFGAATQSVIISAAVEAQPYGLEWPGATDEPGHRDLPEQPDVLIEDHFMTDDNEAYTGDVVYGMSTYTYDFRRDYGFDPYGNQLYNVITPAQMDRAREIFEVFATYFGVQFAEYYMPEIGESGGDITVVTGDLRAVGGTSEPGGVAGMGGGGIAIMDNADNWGTSEFGGNWFQVAMHEIMHNLGFGHTYDLMPFTIMGSGELIYGPGEEPDLYNTSSEPVFPGDADLVHALHMFRPDSTDIDLYEFNLDEAGTFSAEVIAERLADSSFLDSALTLFQEYEEEQEDGSMVTKRRVVARNDDYFSEDAYLSVELEKGKYFIAVTASGNDQFDPRIEDSGIGGMTQGDYELRVNYAPEIGDHLTDDTGTLFDGDADGIPGGVYDFWFNVEQAGNATVFVDKSHETTLTDPGSLANPYNNISDAFAAAQPGDIVRMVGNAGDDGNMATLADNLPYEIGFDVFGSALPDGVAMEIPQDITVMIDAGAVFKLRKANIDVGSSALEIDRSGGVLQVLGTPVDSVYFTSYHNEQVGLDGEPLRYSEPYEGDWGGLVMRNDLDRAYGREILEDDGVFLNYINHADISYGGGEVVVDSIRSVYDPVHMIEARPTVSFNLIMKSADAAMSADPNSFLESKFQGSPLLTATLDTLSEPANDGSGLIGVLGTAGTISGGSATITLAGSDNDFVIATALPRPDFDGVEVIFVQDQATGDQAIARLDQTAGTLRIDIDPAATTANTVIAELQTLGMFTADYERVGPDIHGNRLVENTINGLFVRIRTEAGRPMDKLEVAARFDDTDIVHVISETLVIAGTPGGPMVQALDADTGQTRLVAREDARLAIDPGIVVKMDGSRIETEMGAQLLAEGTNSHSVIFTSLLDQRYGAGGTFDTSSDSSGDSPSGGDWAGLYFHPVSRGSIDHALIAYAGGTTSIEGDFAQFNPVEIRQAVVRIANSTFERNESGEAGDRNGRGDITPATIHVRGAQPVIFDNMFHGNTGSVVSIDVNSLRSEVTPDWGRETGMIDSCGQYADNYGPLVRENRLGINEINGMEVRGGAVTTQSIWDDTDIVHVVFDEIVVPNFHTYGGLRLQSSQAESLVVKLDGESAGFTATGTPLEIDDRIGGTLQIIGTANRPVVLTALDDDAFGAGLDPWGQPQTHTINVITDDLTQGAVLTQIDPTWANYIPAGTPGVSFQTVSGEAQILWGEVANQGDPQAGLGFKGTVPPDIPAVEGEEFDVGTLRHFNNLINEGTEIAQVDLMLDMSLSNLPFDPSFTLKTLIEETPNDTGDPVQDADIITFSRAFPFSVKSQGVTLQLLGFRDLLGNLVTEFVSPEGTINQTTLVGRFTSLEPEAGSGSWRSVMLTEYSNDRNVAVLNESEDAFGTAEDLNGDPEHAEYLGNLGDHLWAGDENLRLGFEVHGNIRLDDPTDVDIYSFDAEAGTEVWLDVDRTTHALDTIIELIDANGFVLASSDDSLEETAQPSLLGGLGLPMNRDVWQTKDYYSTNPRDAGMRLVLPGPEGQARTYYVLVRSAPAEGAAPTDPGITRGSYQLQVRLRELQEVPGSTIRNASIHYATNGIEIYGLPSHSPLTGETMDIDLAAGELNNDIFADAQYIGNLLAADRNTLSVAGNLSGVDDIDWYRFDVDLEGIQAMGVNPLASTWATIFDIDYGDGMARPDATLWVFNQSGELVYVGRDSNLVDDRPDPTKGAGLTDLYRGTVGPLDPFIGTVHLNEGDELSYYVAVTGQGLEADALQQALLRHEPIDSLVRIAEDHIEGTDGSLIVGQESSILFGTVEQTPYGPVVDKSVETLNLHADEFHLGDVTMYVNTAGDLFTVNPFTGAYQTDVTDYRKATDLLPGTYNSDLTYNDIDMRNDGQLYTWSSTGQYRRLSTEDAKVLLHDQDNGVNPNVVFEGMAHEPYPTYSANGSLRTRHSYAVGNREPGEGIKYTTNLLYYFNQNGVTDAPPNSGGDGSYPMARLLTETAIIIPGATHPTNPGNDLMDEDAITITDGDGATRTFEFDCGIDVLMSADVPQTSRDGETFMLDDGSGPITFELDSGAVLMVGDLDADPNTDMLIDGDFFTINGDGGNVTFEFNHEQDQSVPSYVPGRTEILFTGTESVLDIMNLVVDAINAASFNVVATAYVDGDIARISLVNDTAVAIGDNPGTGLPSTSLVVDPATDYGVVPGNIAVPFEETGTITGLGNSIVNVVEDNLNVAAGYARDRLSFFMAVDQDFTGAPSLTYRGGTQGITDPLYISIPFHADDTWETLAAAMEAAINAAATPGSGFTATATAMGNFLSITNGNVSLGQPFQLAGAGPGGMITGITFVSEPYDPYYPYYEFDSMYAVSSRGGLYEVMNYDMYALEPNDDGELVPKAGGATLNYIASSEPYLAGIPFTGVTTGPQNVEDGRYADTLFATDSYGRLHAFNTEGIPQPIFLDGASTIQLTDMYDYPLSYIEGITFSNIDYNLWHVTDYREEDLGHGITATDDYSRSPDMGYPTPGWTSFYFGLEDPREVTTISDQPGADNYIYTNNGVFQSYDMPGGAHGTLTTQSFSLVGYNPGDNPRLTFSYYLETEISNDFDSARVYVSTDGATWDLLATNTDRDDAYIAAISAPLIDGSGEWQQADLPLGAYAGMEDVRIRFDFSTASDMHVGDSMNFDAPDAEFQTGSYLQGVPGTELYDGDYFTVSTGYTDVLFEFDMAYSLITPGGAAGLVIPEGEQFTIEDGYGNQVVFEFDTDTTYTGDAPVSINLEDSPLDVAQAIARAIASSVLGGDLVGVVAAAHENRVVVEGAWNITQSIDPAVLLNGNGPVARATASISQPGLGFWGLPVDIELMAAMDGEAYSGIDIEIVDIPGYYVYGNEAFVTYDASARTLTIQINEGYTTADTVVDALNAEGTFIASTSEPSALVSLEAPAATTAGGLSSPTPGTVSVPIDIGMTQEEVALAMAIAIDGVFSSDTHIIAVDGSQIADGQWFSISDDYSMVTFEFDDDYYYSYYNERIAFDSLDTAEQIADAIADAIEELNYYYYWNPALDVTAKAVGNEVILSGGVVTVDTGDTLLTTRTQADAYDVFTSVKLDGSLIHVIGHTVVTSMIGTPLEEPGELPYSNELVGDHPPIKVLPRGDRFHDFKCGQKNTAEGFYVDDVIVGFAERGEMITAATPDTNFHAVNPGAAITEGYYQLEIRRGTEYGLIYQAPRWLELERSYNTNDRLTDELTLIAPPANEIGRGQTFDISDGVNTATFEYILEGIAPIGGNIPVYLSGLESAAEIANLMAEAINAQGIVEVTAASIETSDRVDLFHAADSSLITETAFDDINPKPSGVAIADLNGDGYTDVVTSNSADHSVSVVLTDVAAFDTYQAPVVYEVGRAPSAVTLEDLNGDLVPDIVVTNYWDHTVSVLLGRIGETGLGDGSFQEQVTYDVGRFPKSLAVADVDGDGIPDIVTANEDDGTVSVLLGNDDGFGTGDGTFAPQVVLPVGAGPVGVRAADLDGAGALDIVTANAEDNTVSVLLLQDVSGAPGSFAAEAYQVGLGPAGVAVGNVTGDAIPDIATANRIDGTVSLLVGDGTGAFADQVTYEVENGPVAIEMVDLSGLGVGAMDIVLAHGEENLISILPHDPNGAAEIPPVYFQEPVLYPVYGQTPVALGVYTPVYSPYGFAYPEIATADYWTGSVTFVLSNYLLPGPIDVGYSRIEILRGDENLYRDQGQIIIEANQILNSEEYAIVVDAGQRDSDSNWAHPASVATLREINTERLVPGITIENNLMAFGGTGGIHFSGDENPDDMPVAAVPFGRIVNNTIYGTGMVEEQGTNQVDVVFVFDVSGSMGSSINDVRNNLLMFDSEMTAAGIDAYYGLVEFPGIGSTDPLLTQDIVDYTTFTAPGSPLNLIQVRGATERGSGAILESLNGMLPATTMNYRPGSKIALVMLTDEDDDSDQTEFVAATNAVATNDALFYYIGNKMSGNTLTRYEVIAIASGGAGFEIADFRADPAPFFTAFTAAFIAGIGTREGAGITVDQNASPTILNNIMANLEVGISVDETCSSTVLGGTVYQNNGVNTEGIDLGSFALDLGPEEPLFVNPLHANFYLDEGSRAIDSSINSLEDRPELTTVKDPLGLPPSPILAPELDLFGQLRADDPSVAPPPGLGLNVFKDRGALDRIDFAGPTAHLTEPMDNDADGLDRNPAGDDVFIAGQTVTQFAIQLTDVNGTGIADATVNATGLTLIQDEIELTEGIDYFFSYDSTNDVIYLKPAAGIWKNGSIYVIELDNSSGGILDLANNPLSPNRPSGETIFIISLSGLDFGDAPDPPYPSLVEEDSDGARHVLIAGYHLGDRVSNEADARWNPTASGDSYDDGVLLSHGLLIGAPVELTVIATGGDGFLDAWIDYNQNGDWGDAGEHIFAAEALVEGENVLTINVPAGLTPGGAFARFRFSSIGGLGLTGEAEDGEVEDYLLTMVEYYEDFGDTPDPTFPTLLINNAARHRLTHGVDFYLGAGVDPEFDGQPSLGAVGDDEDDGNDDEDGVEFVTALVPGEQAEVAVTAVVPQSIGTARLDGWIDFDNSGIWGDGPGEQIFAGEPIVDGLNNLVFAVPASAQKDTEPYVRFRLSSQGGLQPGGAADDGEVEDYQVMVVGAPHDFGDAPDDLILAGYPTLLANNGARHKLLRGFHLGAEIDYEFDGQPDANATGDDLIEVDDEDGVQLPQRLIPGRQFTITVETTNTSTNQAEGYLNVWIDYNGDGDWDDPNEQVFTDVQLANNASTDLQFVVPEGLESRTTFVRFRYSHETGLTPDGPAGDVDGPDGEVEDYTIEIMVGDGTISGHKFDDRNANGQWESEVTNVVPDFMLTFPGQVIMQPNDDSWSDLQQFDFTFEFFGHNYTEFYINNNGNITFDYPLGTYNPAGFPQTTPIVAPFWADVDTRGTGDVRLAKGTSIRGNPFVQVDWVGVGYYSANTDKTNTFTLYIEDDPAGDIVAFVYHDMEWTTGDASGGFNGFGGTGAQIGFDAGDGVNYISLARPNSPLAIANLNTVGQYAFQFDPISGTPRGGREPGLAGWTVYLDLNDNNGLDLGEPYRITAEDDLTTPDVDETGYYEFTDLFAGEYIVREIPQQGWIQTRPGETFYLDDRSEWEITAVDGTLLTDGDTFSVGDGANTIVFEFEDEDIANGVAFGHVAVEYQVADSANEVANAIEDAIDAADVPGSDPVVGLDVNATVSSGVVTVTGTPAMVDALTSPLALTVVELTSHGNPDGTYTIQLDTRNDLENVDFGNYKLGEITISDAALAEGNEGVTEMEFTLHLTQSFGAPVSVDYETQDGSASVLNQDYLYTTGTFTFTPQDSPDPTWTPVSITSNESNDYDYHVSGSYVVWEEYDGNDWEILFYDGSKTLQLTDNDVDDRFSAVGGDHVVWAGFDGNDYEIYHFDYKVFQLLGPGALPADATTRITTNTFDDKGPQVSESAVVWWAEEPGDIEIYYYDFKSGGMPVNISANHHHDYDPRISGSNVVWQGSVDGIDQEIFFYDGTTVTQVTDNITADARPQIDGSIVVWEGFDGTDYEIYHFDYEAYLALLGVDPSTVPEDTTTQITDNTGDDKDPQVSGDNIVWHGYDIDDWEIYHYNMIAGGTPTNLSNNSFLDKHPQICGNTVVWHRFDGTDWEVFYYELYGEHGPVNVSDNAAYDWYPQISDAVLVWRSYDGTDFEILVATMNEPEITGTITVPIVGDLNVEPDEFFYLNLSSPTLAVIGDSQAQGWILNDDGGEHGLDYGDAPDPDYPTLLASNGARHVIDPALYLGATVDAEGDGRPDEPATGDDTRTSDDEDGVILNSPLIAGEAAMLTVTASAAGELDGWIDFNADGNWDDFNERIFANRDLDAGENLLIIEVPEHATLGNTYARFRFSSTGVLSYVGTAMNGEVEDYRFMIGGTETFLDFGDAPDDAAVPLYPTLLENKGARHFVLPGFQLGAAIDFEQDGKPNSSATGDDSDYLNDEDGVAFVGQVISGSQAAVDVCVTNTSTNQLPGYLNAWIDFNSNGNWQDPGEQIFTDVSLSPGDHQLTFNVPGGLDATTTFARFRFSHTAGLTSDGSAQGETIPDGEVEDYRIVIAEQPWDFGDAPDPTYGTLLASNGARHAIVSGFYLGAGVDQESDGQPNADATGDDVAGDNDEDGVAFNSPFVLGATTPISVQASAAGKLDAWIDFNADGDWNDPGERIFAAEPLQAGQNDLGVFVPVAAQLGDTFARFRFSSTGVLLFNGESADGEVEDYALEIQYPANLQDGTLSVSGTGADDTFEFTAGPDVYTVVLNGVLRQYAAADVDTVIFDGGLGNDTATLNGDVGDETAELWPGTAELIGDGFTVDVANTETIDIDGGGGSNLATFFNSPGKDEFAGWAGGATFAGSGVSNSVSGFGRIFAYGTSGQGDLARLYDSLYDDFFVANGTYGGLYADGCEVHTYYFDEVYGYANQDGFDTAKFYDSPHDDVFSSTADACEMSNASYLRRAELFESVQAYGTSTGNDVAHMHDGPGTDWFVATGVDGIMVREQYLHRVKWFEEVYAWGQGDGYNYARLYDTANDDTFNATPQLATLSGQRVEGGTYFNQVSNFDAVHAYAWAGGHDVADLYGSPGVDVYYGSPVEGSMTDNATYWNRAKNFEQVNAHAVANNDVALLFDSALADLLEAEDGWARLSNDTLAFAHYLADFAHVKVTGSSNPGDTKREAAVDYWLEIEGVWEDD